MNAQSAAWAEDQPQLMLRVAACIGLPFPHDWRNDGEENVGQHDTDQQCPKAKLRPATIPAHVAILTAVRTISHDLLLSRLRASA